MIVVGRISAAIIGLGFTAIVSRAGAAQKTFEGVITYQVTSAGTPMEMVVSMRGTKVRQDARMPGSTEAATTYQIIDFATGDVTTVIPEAKSYISMNFKSLRAQMSDRDELEKASPHALGEISATGRKETIAGLPCEVYVFTKRPDDEWCITTSLGHVLGFDDRSGAAGVRNPMSVDPAMSRALSRFKDGALALRMTVRSNSGRPTMIVATKVDRTPPPASLFTVPSDYEQVKNPMMPKP